MGASTKTILIVEDEQPLAQALKVKLSASGFSVLCTANGKDGFEKTLKSKPNLILLDILMPELNGLDMLQKLRDCKNVYCKTVPVIILTNLASKSSVKKGIELGSPDYIIKSDISLAKLVVLIRSRLKDS